MNIAILGTGIVGKTLAGSLSSSGHDVALGTRDPAATMARTEPDMFGRPPVAQWRKEHPNVRLETFAEATAKAEVVINASSGAAGLAPLRAAGAANLDGKILMDVSNPLDFSQGMPPALTVCNTDSLGEQIQRAFPNVKVVKTLNTVNTFLMVDPKSLDDGRHTMFMAGNDADAKVAVRGYLEQWFGWSDIMDLGDITNARGTEMLLPLWSRIYVSGQNPTFAFRVVR